MRSALAILLLSLSLAVNVFAAPVNSFLIQPGSNSLFSSQVRPMPGYVLSRSLAASVAEAFTVPSVARWVIFSATCNFYANGAATATVPGDVTDGSAAELNPAAWFLGQPGTVTSISVISPTTCVVTATFYL